jgi:tetratricopeptide (TPR) repeat protein
MSKFILLFLLLASRYSFAGYIDYYNSINEAEYHMYEGQYDLAISNFNLAFELVDNPKARDYFLAAKCFAQLHQEHEMLAHLEFAIKGGLSKSFIEADSLWFTNYRLSKAYKEVLKTDSNETPAFKNGYSSSAFEQIENMYDFSKVIAYYKAYNQRDNFPSEYETFMKSYKPYRDSLISLITDFILYYSIPTEPKKTKSLVSLCARFLARDNPKIDSIQSMLYKRLDQGDITPIDYAIIFERMPLKIDEINFESKRIYGTVQHSIPENQFEEILENRKSIGLSTYFISAPNYYMNYKPTPIFDIIRHH